MKRLLALFVALILVVGGWYFFSERPQERTALTAPKVTLSPERRGELAAASDASKGHFAFVKGSEPTTSMNPKYPGTDGCYIPGQTETVSDYAYGTAEETARFNAEDAFAKSYNLFLLSHYRERMAAVCQRRPG